MTTAFRPTHLAAPLAGLALVVALAGCGTADSETPPGESPSGPAATSSAPPQASPSGAGSATGDPSPSGSDNGSTASDSDNAALLRAAETALGTVPDSVVISIEVERNDTQWEVQVATPDGTEHEVEVSADGTKVLSGPREESEDADDKAKHKDRMAAAKLDHAAAVQAISDAVPGRITELNLDTENGTTVWEADVIDADNVKHEVTVDAATGKVLQQG